MPNRFQIKPKGAAGQLFHVTSHAGSGLEIFETAVEKREILTRIENYLSPRRIVDANRRPYRKLHDAVSLLAYIILDDHLHLLLMQHTDDGMEQLMRRVLTGYGRYFNQRHRRYGPIFSGRYSAIPIVDTNHAQAAVAYIHLNDPKLQLRHPASSHRLIMGERSVDWVDAARTQELFGDVDHYIDYLNANGPRIIERKLLKKNLPPNRHPYQPIKILPKPQPRP